MGLTSSESPMMINRCGMGGWGRGRKGEVRGAKMKLER